MNLIVSGLANLSYFLFDKPFMQIDKITLKVDQPSMIKIERIYNTPGGNKEF